MSYQDHPPEGPDAGAALGLMVLLAVTLGVTMLFQHCLGG